MFTPGNIRHLLGHIDWIRGKSSTRKKGVNRRHRALILSTAIASTMLIGCTNKTLSTRGPSNKTDASSGTESKGNKDTKDTKDPSGSANGKTDGSKNPNKKMAGAVSSIDDAKGAVVQILVEGEIRDPEAGQTGFSGSGSGFLIDDQGTIVTNNHVVTGAGAMTVLVGGDKSNAIPAKVLGVSECSDLAVIKLSTPGKYPHLEWSTKTIQPPLEVYAAGFPLGDPEYTVTRGVVSKAKAQGDTNWASVAHVIEHDANIQPGNSGGALLDKDGGIVGVNYAGGDAGTGTSQYFAIANDLAEPTVELLRKGDQESIGVNGRAFISEDKSTGGVFVRGVAPGGPASKAGVKPGDVIMSLNGVAVDGGTLGQYCKVLRSARENAPITIRVLRLDQKQVLEGELNGKPLEPVFSFEEELKKDVPKTGAAPDPGADEGYARVVDDTGKLSVELPVAWSDQNLAPQDLLGFGTDQATIFGAPKIKDFENDVGPGIAVILAELNGIGTQDKDKLLDAVDDGKNGCEKGERNDFSDGRFSGRFLAAKCGETLFVVALLTPSNNPDQTVVMFARAVTEQDLAYIDHVLGSFDTK